MLICCRESSRIELETNRSFRLHAFEKFRKSGCKASGFTIIEVLIVVLVIGILSGAAVGSYSGVISDSRQRSAQDRLDTYFRACRDRAKLRRTSLRVVYNEKQEGFYSNDSTNYFLKAPELYKASIPQEIDIDPQGRFKIDGKEADHLSLTIKSRLLKRNR